MKKLFSYLLISSMVVLSSCTNYDDQFDDLNTQINTLKSQIEGFSSLSSGLTALQGTVASLQSAINNIPVTPATDISGLEASLAALSTTVEALQTSLASAATAAEVAALQTALTAAQADLTELLASNNVYSDNIVISSAATLAVAKNLGGKLAIINGNVTITQSSAMSAADLQEVLDVMVTVTGDISYTMVSNASTQGVFNNLTSVGNLTLDVAGSINLPLLENAGAIKFGTTHKNFVTAIEMPVLASVTSFATDTAVDTIDFSKATAITLTALANYDGATPASSKLTIAGKLDFALDLAALTSKTAAGAKNPIALTIEGAKEVTLPLFTEGSVTANTTEKIVLATFKGGTSDSFLKAEYLHLQAYERDLLASQISTNLETLIFNGVAPATATTAAGYPNLNITGATGLTTLTVSGKLEDVTMSGNTSLTDITFSGSANDVVLSGATSLETAVLAHTGSAITTSESSLTVIGNTELTSLTVDALVNAGKLLITGNTSLETLSFAKLAGIGVAKVPMVDISNNNLTATSVDYTAAGTTAAAIAAGGTGSIVSESGLSTLKTYLGKAATASTAAGSYTYVAFDTVDKFINLSDEESGPFTYTVSNGKGLAANANLEVINVSPAAGAVGAVAASRSIILAPSSSLAINAKGSSTDNVISISLGASTNISNQIAQINQDLASTTSGIASNTLLANAGYAISLTGAETEGTLTIPSASNAFADTLSATIGTITFTLATATSTITVPVSSAAGADAVASFTISATSTSAGVITAASFTTAGSDLVASELTKATAFAGTYTSSTSTVTFGTVTATLGSSKSLITIGDKIKVTFNGTSLSYTIGLDDEDATTLSILGLVNADLDASLPAIGTATNTAERLSTNDLAKIVAKLVNNSDFTSFVPATGLYNTTLSATNYDKKSINAVASGNVITFTNSKQGSLDTTETSLKLELVTAAAVSGANTTATSATVAFGSNGYIFGDMKFTRVLAKVSSTVAGLTGDIGASDITGVTPITALGIAGTDAKVFGTAIKKYLITDNAVTGVSAGADISFDADNLSTSDYVFAKDSATATTAASTTNKVSWL